MPLFRKRPVDVEAIQWNGNNEIAIMDFVGKKLVVSRPPHQRELELEMPMEAWSIYIPTLEGEMRASKMDWIIKGVKGEFYPCKPDIFEHLYYKIEGGENIPSADLLEMLK